MTVLPVTEKLLYHAHKVKVTAGSITVSVDWTVLKYNHVSRSDKVNKVLKKNILSCKNTVEVENTTVYLTPAGLIDVNSEKLSHFIDIVQMKYTDDPHIMTK